MAMTSIGLRLANAANHLPSGWSYAKEVPLFPIGFQVASHRYNICLRTYADLKSDQLSDGIARM
jgi:hypothetical protein